MGDRTIVPDKRFFSQEISPGVVWAKFYPGGLNGPNDEVLIKRPGGQVWSDFLFLGDEADDFQMAVPDIRMPPNQYWPMHWHDAWTVVLVVEGSCLIGDWWMQVGDIFITEPSLEYGPLVIGPGGCRLFEIFSNKALARGGYALEYKDHPTLIGVDAVFIERSALNKRNDGRQILPLDAAREVVKSRLEPGKIWNLGHADDPKRSVMMDRRLAAGETLAAHRYDDWHAIVVLGGSMSVGGNVLSVDDYLLLRPGAAVDEIKAGALGVQLLEFARTSKGVEPILTS